MSHIDKRDVHAYLDGALGAYTEVDARHVREHLDTCGECRRLLEREKRLREEASTILAASAAGPVQLDPLEELLARAVSNTQQSALGGPDAGAAKARPALGSRMYSLRWAATVVVSLGAGWIARDLSKSAEDSVRGAMAEGLVTEAAQSSAEREGTEQDEVGPLAEQVAELPVGAPRPRADSNTLRERANATALGVEGGVSRSESRGAQADEVVRDLDRSPGDDDVALDQVRTAPVRPRGLEPAARGLAPAGAPSVDPAAERRAKTASLTDGLLSSTIFSSVPFMVPGLPVRDVRLESEADGPAAASGGSVVVTQELDDGLQIELRFIPLNESDAVRVGASEEWSNLRNGARGAGWATTVRSVPGGVAVLSGPLPELELAELLGRALGAR
jgi:hypothetical protein